MSQHSRIRSAAGYGQGYSYPSTKVWLARVIEWFTAPLPWLTARTNEIRKILILEPYLLGDAALLAIMLAPLKARFPEADIHLLVQSSSVGVFKNDPRVSKTHGFSFPWVKKTHKYYLWQWRWRELIQFVVAMRRERFDVGIDSRGEIRNQVLMCLFGCSRRVGFTNYLCSNLRIRGTLLTDSLGNVPLQHRTRINMELCTFGTENGQWSKRHRSRIPGGQAPSLPYAAPALKSDAEAASLASTGPFTIVFHTGGGWQYKLWDDDCWAELISRAALAFRARISVIGAAVDKERLDTMRQRVPDTVQFMVTQMDDLMRTLCRASLIVCLDSGPMNIASMLGKPILALFGPGLVEMYAPISAGSRVIHHQHKFPCAPCGQSVCVSPHANCVNDISSDEVFETLTQMVPAHLWVSNSTESIGATQEQQPGAFPRVAPAVWRTS